MWLKYKDKYNKYDKWHWKFLSTSAEDANCMLEEELEELYRTTMYDCTIDYELIELPPVDVLTGEVKRVHNYIKYYVKLLSFMNSKLEEAKTIEAFENLEEGPNSWKPDGNLSSEIQE